MFLLGFFAGLIAVCMIFLATIAITLIVVGVNGADVLRNLADRLDKYTAVAKE